MAVSRRLQSLQQHQQVRAAPHHKPSSEHHHHQLGGGHVTVGGVSGGGAWPGDRGDVSDSDDDDAGEICVVDDDETTTNNDNNDDHGDDDRRLDRVASPEHRAVAGYRLNAAYDQQMSPPRASADIYPAHKLQGGHCRLSSLRLQLKQEMPTSTESSFYTVSVVVMPYYAPTSLLTFRQQLKTFLFQTTFY